MELSRHQYLIQKQQQRRQNRSEGASKSAQIPAILSQALQIFSDDCNCDVKSSNSSDRMQPQVSSRLGVAAKVRPRIQPMHAGHKQSVQVPPIRHETETELSWPESPSSVKRTASPTSKSIHKNHPRNEIPMQSFTDHQQYERNISDLSQAIRHYLKQLQPVRSTLFDAPKSNQITTNDVMSAIQKSQIQQQDKLILVDQIQTPDEPEPRQVDQFKQREYLASGEKLMTLIEQVTMEDLAELDSPVGKFQKQKGRHKKAQPSQDRFSSN